MVEYKVYHIGYSAGGAEDHVKALMSDPKMLIIDTRLTPYSWRSGWCRDDQVKAGRRLPGLLSQWGKRYRWAGQFLGNLGHKFGTIDIADLDEGIRGLMMYLREGHPLILLCQCSVVEDCHRFVIMRALKAAMPEVQFYAADGKPELALAS